MSTEQSITTLKAKVEELTDLLKREKGVSRIMANAAWYAVTGNVSGWTNPFEAINRLLTYTKDLSEAVDKLTNQVCELRTALYTKESQERSTR